MASHITAAQGFLSLILTSLSLYIVHTNGSPLHQMEEHRGACPKDWYHYNSLCLTRARRNTERAVALYCDGLGGIGIRDLCIIRAPEHSSLTREQELLLRQALGLMTHLDSQSSDALGVDQGYGHVGSDPTAMLDNEANNDSDDVCPKGFTHYQSLCVYKPLTIEETCHQLHSKDFHGLCVKLANIKAKPREDEMKHDKSGKKRVCCCNHVKNKNNTYGC